jgi:hypothetical protein
MIMIMIIIIMIMIIIIIIIIVLTNFYLRKRALIVGHFPFAENLKNAGL